MSPASVPIDMRFWNSRPPPLPFLLLGVMLGTTPAHACSVPVFRYALEHWKADAYEAIVLHHGPLTEVQQAMVRTLRAGGAADKLPANLSLSTADLDSNPAPELAELGRQIKPAAYPWVVLRSPRKGPAGSVLWSGPLNEVERQPLIESPARKEIITRLAQGQSAVWLLLESGDPDQDAAAAKLVEARLAYLAATLTLPKLEAIDIANGLVSIGQDDLRLEFSLLRLARQAPAEQPFIQMLLGTEPDLGKVREPIIFPVFGRGRALYALVGSGIRRETIDQAASFLIGKCSCQVKEQNPGSDLLLAANWEQLIKAQTNGVPDLPTLAELAKLAPATVTITGGEPVAPGSPPDLQAATRQNPGIAIYAVGCLLAAVVLAGFLISRK